MDAALRGLSAGGPLALGVLGGAALGVVLSLAATFVGLRRRHTAGSPTFTLGLAVALLAPLLAIFAGLSGSTLPAELVRSLPTERLVALFAERVGLRAATGLAGVFLGPPLGVAACLWAGIAAERRARRAGERARLSASAAGFPEAGATVAAALDRSWAPLFGAATGLFAGVTLGALPSWFLWLSAAGLIEVVELANALDPAVRGVVLASGLAEAASRLEWASWIGAAGALVTGALLGGGLHVRSSRRRCLHVAHLALERAGATRPAMAAVTTALSATGKPRALGPAALALLLLVLAAVAALEARRLDASRRQAPEALASAAAAPPSSRLADRW